ncbi:MAG: hypothetical protein ACOZNI_34055 [Myxococcota bacterium]
MLTLLIALACYEETACTDLAAASSLVHVVGPDGEPLVAEISAVDEDGNPVEATCAGADPEACTNWIVGYEVAGEIEITATADDGCNTGTGVVIVDVQMDEDGCHVVQQEATLTVDEWTDLDCG